MNVLRKQLWISLFVVLGAVFILPWAAAAQLSEDDEDFLVAAGQSNLRQIALGNIALQRSPSVSVRNLGRTMVTNSTAAQGRLIRVANARGFALPTEVSDGDEDTLDYFATIGVDRFDERFRDQVIRDSRKDLKDYNDEVAFGEDPAVIAYARSTIPALQRYLVLARQPVTGAAVSTSAAAAAARRPIGSTVRRPTPRPTPQVALRR